MSIAIKIFAGLALLAFGRKLFWLFGAAVGFVVAMTFSAQFFYDEMEWTQLILALAGGVIGALLALFVQRIAVGVAGFVAGGFFLVNLVEVFHLHTGSNFWIPFIIGGIVGAVLMMLIFDWALVILSSGLGAYLFVHELHLNKNLELVTMIFVFIVGVIAQRQGMKKKKSEKPQKKPEESS